MPQLRALHEKYPKQMVVLGVNAGETPEQGAAGARRMGLTFPVLLRGDSLMEQYAASGFPTTYLIDPTGKIVEAQVGANPGLWPRVEAVVSRFQAPGEEREGTGGPRKAEQITHEMTFPLPPGPREWIVGRDVTIRFNRPEGIQADLVAFSVDGKQLAAFGAGSAYTWDATPVSNGPHTLRVAAQTASGRETWAVEQVVIVDNRPTVERRPPAQKARPANGQAAAGKNANGK
jgi:hypothetical protein